MSGFSNSKMAMVAALALAMTPSEASLSNNSYTIRDYGGRGLIAPTWGYKSPGASVDPGGKNRAARRKANKAARKSRNRNRK